jgi:hypothetical protein
MARELLNSDRFTLNRSEVAMQIIDGEAVATDVITGRYHGMDGVACGVVNLMARSFAMAWASSSGGDDRFPSTVQPGRSAADSGASRRRSGR